ncbi:thioredoxin domain-containing protein [Streptomyces fractus]|uniref:thioredoxin domain-containing protein n=1 Tax=Streptomyces fractus TaxID=641806 RepID=UPI003CF162E1
MGKKNNAEARRRREEMVARREADKRKVKKRQRTVLVALGVAGALVLGGGVAYAVKAGSSPSVSQLTSQTYAAPKHTSGTDGTTVTYGDKDSKNTLDVYMDMRCPYCAEFEQTDGTTIQKLADDGDYKIVYHFGTFLDDNLGGTGSINALNALGAALNVSTDAFAEYQHVLWENHPDENDDKFSGNSDLIDLAQQVPALKDNQSFNDAVNNGTYYPWAQKMSDQFGSSGVTGTPTVELNGKKLTVIDSDGKAISTSDFTKQVEDRVK